MTRDAIFSKIRSALTVTPNDATDARLAVADRLARAPRGLVPEIARTSGRDALERFCERAEAQGTAIVRASNRAEIPGRIAAYLSKCGSPMVVRTGPFKDSAELPWQAAGITLTYGAAGRDDSVGLSVALAGIAETGTVVLASSARNPASVAFLPETHIVILDAREVVGGLEDAFDCVRAASATKTLPRTLNLITGPSRTGDIGGRIIKGAHGPRRLAVVVVG